MLKRALRQNTEENRFIRLILVFALMFGTAHVSLHDLDESGGGLHADDECQVCRLNHVPITSFAIPSLVEPLPFLAYLLPVEDTKHQLSRSFHAQWARAPPLS